MICCALEHRYFYILNQGYINQKVICCTGPLFNVSSLGNGSAYNIDKVLHTLSLLVDHTREEMSVRTKVAVI